MKLTTARLKKLIREELNNVKEAIRIPGDSPIPHTADSLGYSPKNLENPKYEAVKEAIAKVMKKHGMNQQEADKTAANVATELMKPASGYALNLKKSSNPKHTRQPEGQREEYFMIIANMLKGTGMEEEKSAAIAQEASYEVSRVMRPEGSKGIMLPYDAMGDAGKMERD